MVKKLKDEISIVSKLIISFSYLLSVTLAYALMLCIMSFNSYVFIVVVLSITLGNSWFGFMKKRNITVGSLASEKAEELIFGGGSANCCDPLIENGS